MGRTQKLAAIIKEGVRNPQKIKKGLKVLKNQGPEIFKQRLSASVNYEPGYGRVKKEKLKNYTIYRIPLVLSNPLEETFMYHGNRDDIMDVITKEDCAYAFVKGIKYSDKLNKRTFDLASSETIKYGDLLDRLLEINGLSFKYVLSRVFLEKDYYSPVCTDRDELEEIIHYRNDYINAYYNRLKSKNRKRKFQKMLGKLLVNKK